MQRYNVPRWVPDETRRDFEKLAEIARSSEAWAARDPAGFQRYAARLSKIFYFTLPAFALGLAAVLAVGWAYALSVPTRAVLQTMSTLTFFAAATIFAILRSIPFRHGKPDGIAISRDKAPDLVSLIEEVRTELGGPPIDQIYLTDDLNAAVVQRPIIGPLGKFRNELIIGLPLMQALSVPEFKGVVAHEIGHLIGDHGKAYIWWMRGYRIWSSFESHTEGRRSLTDLPINALRKIFEKRVFGVSFVMSRDNEFVADQFEARVVGPRIAARTMVRITIADRFLGQFWDSFTDRCAMQETDCPGPYAELDQRLKTLTGWDGAKGALNTELAQKTGVLDSHPSLEERLHAFGHQAYVPGPIQTSASILLGGLRTEAIAEFDRRWWVENAESIKEYRRFIGDLSERRRLFERTFDANRLDEVIAGIKLAEDVDDPQSTIDQLAIVIEQWPGSARAQMLLANCHFKRRAYEAAIAAAEAAANLDASAAMAAAEICADVSLALGDVAGAELYQERGMSEAAIASFEAAADADRWLAKDVGLLETCILESEIEQARKALEGQGWIERAFFVRRPVREWLDVASLHIVVVPCDPAMASSRLDRLGDVAGNLVMQAVPDVAMQVSIARGAWKWIGDLMDDPRAISVIDRRQNTELAA